MERTYAGDFESLESFRRAVFFRLLSSTVDPSCGLMHGAHYVDEDINEFVIRVLKINREGQLLNR